MTPKAIFAMKVGDTFKYCGSPAKVKWVEDTKFLISKGDPNAKGGPTPDIYWRSISLAFDSENRRETTTIVSCMPEREDFEWDEFTR